MERQFSEDSVATKAAWFKGWFPNLKSRRKAKKMTVAFDDPLGEDIGTNVEVQSTDDADWFQEGASSPETPNLIHGADQIRTNFQEGASSTETPNLIQQPTDERYIDFESRRSTLNDVIEALSGSQINPIIICGMVGIGKTTLMHQVVEEAKKKGLFDEFTKATIKESLDKVPDLSLVQDELAGFLGLSLAEKDIAARASKLRERLSQGSKKILVQLDDVYSSTPDFLRDIGIPPSCKLLVTSRRQDLFQYMDTRKNFPIGDLPDGDAWTLFKKRAGSSIESDPELKAVARKFLKVCAGLPLLISTVGNILQSEQIVVWKNALKLLQRGNSGMGYLRSQFSIKIYDEYDKIMFICERLPSNETKLCVLLCCMFGENADIPIKALVTYGLGFFGDIDSIVERRRRVKALVHTLKNHFYLSDSDEPDCLRMPDVVHNAVAYYVSIEYGIVLKDKEKTLDSIRLPKNIFSEQSTWCISVKSTENLILLLRGKSGGALDPLPTKFRMGNLKVLAIEHLSLPSLAVNNLQTLCLERCLLEFDVSVIGELRTLIILSLRGSDIKQLPDTFRNLSNLRSLDLSECSDLKIVSPGVISSLSRLEELYMWASFQDWVVEKLGSTETTCWISQLEAGPDEVDKWKRMNKSAVEQAAILEECEQRTMWANSIDWTTGILAELLSLSRLTTLEVVLPPINKLLTSSLFNKLERFKICIGWEVKSIRELKPSENYLRVCDLDARSVIGSGIASLLKRTNFLESSMTNFTAPVSFVNLKSLEVRDYDGEYLIDVTRKEPSPCRTDLPVLDSLSITGARRLKEIFNGELPMGYLKKLRLCLCDLPAFTYLPSLPGLEDLQLSLENCSLNFEVLSLIGGLRMLQILCLSGSDIKQLPDTFKNLSNLRVLDLSRCFELKIISPGAISSLLRLEELYMWHSCDAIEDSIFSELFSLFSSPALEVVLPKNESYILLSNKLARFTISVNGNYLTVDGLKEKYPVRIPLLLKKCNSLELTMKNLTEPLNVLVKECCFANLTALVLKDCDALEYLFDMTVVKPVPCSSVFPVLFSLEIKGASRLKEIFHGELPMGSFKKLRKLVLDSLPVLTYVWKIESQSECFRDILSTVEVLKIEDCSSLQGLVALEGLGHHEEEAAKEINFQSLTELTLSNLPSLTGVSKNIIEKRTELETTICNPWRRSIGICKEIEEAATNENLETSAVSNFLFDEKVLFPRLERLTINGLPKLTTIWHSQLAQNSFFVLRGITVQRCNNLTNILPDSIIAIVFQQLQNLTVEHCGVEEIVSKEEGPEMLMHGHFFPMLECLELRSLFRFERIYPGMPAAFSWLQLKTLVLLDCQKVDIYAPEFSGLQKVHGSGSLCTMITKPSVLFLESSFPRLEDLTFGNVDICYGQPVSAESCEKAPFHVEDGSIPHLRRLRLHGMEKLMCVWKNAEPAQPYIPQLEILQVEFCGLNHLELTAISFGNLTILEVTFCWRLQYLTSYSAAKSLVQLKKLKVDECKSMIQIIAGEDVSNCEVLFPKLQQLELSDLINLERFCPRNCTVKVPLLETSALKVNWCPFKLKISSDQALEADFSDMHPLQMSHSRKEEALDSTEISMMTEHAEILNVATNVGKQLGSKQVDDLQINSLLQCLSKLDADRSRLQEELRLIDAERRQTEKKLADATGDPLPDSSPTTGF